MSQRPPVDQARIELFLAELGRRFDHPGRLYLVGGHTVNDLKPSPAATWSARGISLALDQLRASRHSASP